MARRRRRRGRLRYRLRRRGGAAGKAAGFAMNRVWNPLTTFIATFAGLNLVIGDAAASRADLGGKIIESLGALIQRTTGVKIIPTAGDYPGPNISIENMFNSVTITGITIGAAGALFKYIPIPGLRGMGGRLRGFGSKLTISGAGFGLFAPRGNLPLTSAAFGTPQVAAQGQTVMP